jgi:hypothetical protein
MKLLLLGLGTYVVEKGLLVLHCLPTLNVWPKNP